MTLDRVHSTYVHTNDLSDTSLSSWSVTQDLKWFCRDSAYSAFRPSYTAEEQFVPPNVHAHICTYMHIMCILYIVRIQQNWTLHPLSLVWLQGSNTTSAAVNSWHWLGQQSYHTHTHTHSFVETRELFECPLNDPMKSFQSWLDCEILWQ